MSLLRFTGSVFPLIAPKVALTTAFAFVLAWLEHRAHVPQLPMAPFTVLGTALGLLLSFRTNSSYERWWEARKAWGNVVNRSRNLARAGATNFPDEKTQEDLARYIVGFAHSMKRQLWKESDVPELARPDLLPPPGPAQRCALAIGKIIREARGLGWISDTIHLSMEGDVTTLIDQLGVCERIQRTPIPVGYALHLHRFIFLYCLSLTLALVDTLGWLSPFTVALIAYAFFGIERVGIEIEDPFHHTANDLDLESITRTIERDVKAMLAPG